MYTFQYKHGDRPLEGFTIQRAAGRGGFGEVYYALSDAGREVALKVVTGYEQIELRGISQCMNLKSPHLVTIFDVKYNAQGRPFVIMEYVSGPSLRQLLDEHPSGLGEQKSAFFLREIAKGLTFLHDCGIVHRDLKPGNIFYENGYVKIGDYGLSKAITTSQHSGQTVTVGTVHYMAPEVGAGKYDRGIDIYAMGAVLYEMLTGTPPFVGASPSEILLKHLSAQPDCTNLAEPYATVVKRAMAKDPNERYQSVQEMVEAVFGTEHVRQSMSVFSPEELSVVAGRVAQHVAVGAGAAKGSATPSPTSTATREQEPDDPWDRFAGRFEKMGDRIAGKAQEATDRFAGRFDKLRADPSRDYSVPVIDPMSLRGRIGLALVTIGVVSIAAAILTQSRGTDPAEIAGFVGVAVVGAVGSMMLVRFRLFSRIDHESRGVQRMILGGAAAIGMFVLAGPIASDLRRSSLFVPGTWVAMLAPIFLSNVRTWLNPLRGERIRLGAAIGAAILAFIAAMAFHGSGIIAISVVGGIALACQALAPWNPIRATIARATSHPPSPMNVYDNLNIRSDAPATGGAAPLQSSPQQFMQRQAPAVFRFIWLFMVALAMGSAVACFVGAGNSNRSDFPIFIGIGVGLCLLAICSLLRAVSGNYYGLWNYLIRPLLLAGTLAVSVGNAAWMGQMGGNNSDFPIAAFCTVFFALIFIMFLCIPGKVYFAPAVASPQPIEPQEVSPYTRMWALLFSALGLLGINGIHRLYVGKVASGILWLVTFGLFGVGQIIDALFILMGEFSDKEGRKLTIWEDPSELKKKRDPLKQPTIVGAPRPGNHIQGLFSAAAGLMLAVAMVLGIGIALDLPGAVSSGVFGNRFAADAQQFFNGYSNWPSLAIHLATMAMGVLAVVGAFLQIAARRGHGGSHIIRGILGTVGLALSVALLHGSFGFWQGWEPIAALSGTGQTEAAVDAFFNRFQVSVVLMTNIVFLASMVLLGWPPRKAVHGGAA